jgi:hypothetical protein
MRVLLDGTQCSFSAETIATAIEQGVEQAHALGRVVVQIDIDNQTMELEQLQDQGYTSQSAGEISLTSLTEYELLLSSLDLGQSAIEVAQQHFTKAAQLIQTGNTPLAMTEMSQGIELWQTVEETVFREAVPKIQHPDIPQQLEVHVNSLRSALSTVQTAMNAGDMVSLGDILLYEFPETSQEWARFLENCAVHLKEQLTPAEHEDPST